MQPPEKAPSDGSARDQDVWWAVPGSSAKPRIQNGSCCPGGRYIHIVGGFLQEKENIPWGKPNVHLCNSCSIPIPVPRILSHLGTSQQPRYPRATVSTAILRVQNRNPELCGEQLTKCACTEQVLGEQAASWCRSGQREPRTGPGQRSSPYFCLGGREIWGQ